MDTLNTILQIVSRVLGINPGSIDVNCDMTELENYDSLRSMMILVEVEKTFGVKIPEDDLFDLITINDWTKEVQKLKS